MINQILLTEISPADLKALIASSIREEIQKAMGTSLDGKTYSVHAACKILNRGTRKVKEFIKEGVLKATPDGRIPHLEIVRYLAELAETN